MERSRKNPARVCACILSLVSGVGLSAGVAQSPGLPRIEKSGAAYRLIVDAKPFFVLGAQVHNSSGWPRQMEEAWPVLKAMHSNTVSVPVYWEATEPEPGHFDFANVDNIVQGARAHGLHVLLSWFGTWKNGAMTYVPVWVKNDPAKYPPVMDAAHHPVEALSPLGDATRVADSRAFAALMKHLKAIDGSAHTVIMVQVENEAGTLGSDRDYSAAGDASFASLVPQDVLAALGEPATAGAPWSQVFAERAPEAFMSYWTSRYIDAVAEAGKAEYALPMYVNVWPREQPGLIRPGYSSPSGGAVAWLLPMWKATATHVDFIAPDIYDESEDSYQRLLTLYDRPDNPLYVPETGGSIAHAKNMFLLFSSPNALGISIFGVDGGVSAAALDADKGWSSEVAENFALFGAESHAMRSASDAGHLQAAIEQEGLANPMLSFDRFEIAVRFGLVEDNYGGPRGQGNPQRNGRVLAAQVAPNEFFVSGMNANLLFAPKLGAKETKAMLLSVEEGSFDSAGVWHTERLLNGDETAFGVILEPHGTTLRVKVRAY
jgi:hypothetical protein